MSGHSLEDSVRALLETQLDSFEKLEIMQSLHASGRAMSQDEISVVCLFRSDIVRAALLDLERAQLVERDNAGLVRPGRGSREPVFLDLMQLYGEDRAGVLFALSSIAMQRIRSMAATAFADTFALRKKRDDDS